MNQKHFKKLDFKHESGLKITSIGFSIKENQRYSQQRKIKILADVKIILNDVLQLNEFTIIQTKNGISLSFPIADTFKNLFNRLVRPLNESIKEYIENEVLTEYYFLLKAGSK